MMTQNRRTIAKKWTVHIHLPLIPFRPDSKLSMCVNMQRHDSLLAHTCCHQLATSQTASSSNVLLNKTWMNFTYNISEPSSFIICSTTWVITWRISWIDSRPFNQSINQSNQSLWLFYLFFTRSLQQEEISQTNSNIYRWRNDSINIKQAVKSSLHHILCCTGEIYP